MSFYIAFDNVSSFLETDEFVDLIAESNEAAIAVSSEKISELDPAKISTNTPSKDEDLSVNTVCLADCDKTNAAVFGQISSAIEFANKILENADQKLDSKIEAEKLCQNDNYRKFNDLLKKFEVSLHYRYDSDDIFHLNLETKESQNLGRLIEKNFNKRRLARQEDSEKRFREKQIKDFKEYLKQKRFAILLQDKTK